MFVYKIVCQGILGCDLVGFHIDDYCINFVDCCQRGLGCRVDRVGLLVEHGGRTVRKEFNWWKIPICGYLRLGGRGMGVKLVTESHMDWTVFSSSIASFLGSGRSPSGSRSRGSSSWHTKPRTQTGKTYRSIQTQRFCSFYNLIL